MTGRSALLTSATLACFAANSLLCRAALAPGLADAASFTLVRLVAGALALALLARLLPGSVGAIRGGSWASALALAGYALAFSFAYLRLDAGVGALVLFAAVQAGMIGSGLWRGDRPRPREWAGLGLALSGLAGLARPGRTAPDPLGLGLMALAGLAWAAYTLRGRSAPDPLAATADNFRRSVPFGLAALLLLRSHHMAPFGLGLAVASGALASGLGYTLWYAALRGLDRSQAAVVQLAVPVLAALGGILLLGEAPSLRLAVCGATILGGIAIALSARR